MHIFINYGTYLFFFSLFFLGCTKVAGQNIYLPYSKNDQLIAIKKENNQVDVLASIENKVSQKSLHIDRANNKLDIQSEKWSSLSKKINSILDDNTDLQNNFKNDLSVLHKALLDELVISNQLVKDKTLFFHFYFKEINDTYGHLEGDKALVIVSNKLKSVSPSKALCARWGGEEFIVFLPNASPQISRAVSDQIRQQFNQTQFNISKHVRFNVSVSIGVSDSRSCEGKVSIDALVNLTDQSLYQAKASGKNCVCGEVSTS